MIYLYSQWNQGQRWLRRYCGKNSTLAVIFGFTATGLIPRISAAGATPQEREYTAIADAEFLATGGRVPPQHPLPNLMAGISPVVLTRAVVESLKLPTYLFNAGLLHPPTVKTIDLGGVAANCVTSGCAMSLDTVKQLFQQGLQWGEKLAKTTDYLIIGECVVGGTTTALSLLTGLGIEARGMVNSSHPCCNHQQKWSIVEQGLKQAGLWQYLGKVAPLDLVAAVGDPMQIVAAGMAIAASRHGGVLLAGGTQMLAVYALVKVLSQQLRLAANIEEIVVGTTRWVAEDPTGNTVQLARTISGVTLLATGLNFTASKYSGFRTYEQGYVKEGVGAGGCAIAAYLKQGITSIELLTVIEALWRNYQLIGQSSPNV
ncbi:MAG TPA: nicotinate mononucleotide-dependent phosphoribosyltransferase CobT [Xenococcaceae cyanobacterium]